MPPLACTGTVPAGALLDQILGERRVERQDDPVSAAHHNLVPGAGRDGDPSPPQRGSAVTREPVARPAIARPGHEVAGAAPGQGALDAVRVSLGPGHGTIAQDED